MRLCEPAIAFVQPRLWSVVLAGVLCAGCAPDPATMGAASDVEIAPASEPGSRLVLSGTLYDARGRPVPGATIRAYHMDTHGSYADPANPGAPARLMGSLRTGSAGEFRVRTIVPGASSPAGGEAPHVHFEVTSPGHGRQSLVVYLALGGTPTPAPLEARPLFPDLGKASERLSGRIPATLDSLGVWQVSVKLSLR